MSVLSLVLALIMYIAMIVMNALANTLPINGITTGDVSFKYPNLFQPTGFTFSIWGIIYLLLAIYLIVQFVTIKSPISEDLKTTYMTINLLFAASSLLNGLWLLTWHYDKIFLSTIVMIFLLITLAIIAKIIPAQEAFTKATFSVYFGWITIATIANITIWLVKIGVPNVTTTAVILTAIILLIGLAITSLWIIREKDITYGLVILWAYLGIFLRHFRTIELNREYPLIYITALVSMVILIGINVFTQYQRLQ